MKAPTVIAEFSILADARDFVELKREDGGEYHVCAGINHRWAVTAIREAQSVYEVPHIQMGVPQAN